MRHDLNVLGRRQGKTFQILWYVRYAMVKGITVAIGSSQCKILHDYIKQVFPDAKLVIEGRCVVVNPLKDKAIK